jgi:hypothetical protein
MDSRLDVLLGLAREPEPADDLFVKRVMANVRPNAHRRLSLARPVAAAAAVVVLLAGGAVALIRSTGSTPAAGLATTLGTKTPRPAPPPAALQAPTRGSGGQTARGAEESKTYRDGDREWGYTSRTSSYAMDRETGLRLRTEIYRTEFDTDVPQRVTLTLTNTGKRPVTISASKGCALMVAAYPAESAGADAQSWQCATASGNPTAPSEEFVLAPGEKHSADATIVLGARGDWSVVGMCRCTYGRSAPPTSKPDGNVLDDLARFGAQLPTLPVEEPEPQTGERLVTPPIRVTAS